MVPVLNAGLEALHLFELAVESTVTAPKPFVLFTESTQFVHDHVH